MCGLLADTPHLAAALAQTIHLHRPRSAEFLSPTAIELGTGAMIRNANTSGPVSLPAIVEKLLIDVATDGFTLHCCGPKTGIISVRCIGLIILLLMPKIALNLSGR